jgi:hypothetical protein
MSIRAILNIRGFSHDFWFDEKSESDLISRLNSTGFTRVYKQDPSEVKLTNWPLYTAPWHYIRCEEVSIIQITEIK